MENPPFFSTLPFKCAVMEGFPATMTPDSRIAMAFYKTEDVMMAHPDAWGFPDTSRVVAANPGEPVNPFHGAQSDQNGVSEWRRPMAHGVWW